MNQATPQDNKLWTLTASALFTAGLCFQWTRFIRSVVLWENDFGGLLCLLIEGGLLLLTGASCIAR